MTTSPMDSNGCSQSEDSLAAKLHTVYISCILSVYTSSKGQNFSKMEGGVETFEASNILKYVMTDEGNFEKSVEICGDRRWGL